LCAIVVLPLGVAYAQDFEAVGKRLRAAVEAGELTGEQASVMMGALKKAGGAKECQEPDAVKAYLEKVKKELGALIESGHISEEDAKKRFADAEKAVKQRLAAGRGEMRAKKSRGLGNAREYLMQLRRELGAAVEAGKISEDDARKKFGAAEKAIKKKMAAERGSKSVTPEDLRRAGIEIRKAVAEGKISAEDGRAKMAAMRKMMGEESEDATKTRSRADWEGIKRRIEGAVERGLITREEADAKYLELRKGMAERREE